MGSTDTMAETCGTTRGAGNNRAYEDAVNTRINGDLQEVESDLPEDIRDRALSVFRAAISDKATVQQAIEKVQKEALVEVETRFKAKDSRGLSSLTMTPASSPSTSTSLGMVTPSSLLAWESRRWSALTPSWAD